MKINEAKQKFIENLGIVGRSPATIVAYEKDIDQLQEFLENIDVSQITTKQLQTFINKMGENGFSNKTLSRKLNSIKSLFKFLLKKGHILIDVSKPIPHPDIQSKLPRVLSETEYRGLRDAAKNNSRLYTIIELMLQTGMRIGEVSRIKIEDLTLNQEPSQAVVGGHSSSPMRVVELNNAAKSALKNYLPQRLEVENDEGYVFNTKNGSHMMIRNIRSAVNRIFKKAGVKNATVNDLRNTFITVQLENGISMEKVGSMVGHRRTTSTEKYLPLIKRKPGKKSGIVEL
jgi:site-specific recombinase XerD